MTAQGQNCAPDNLQLCLGRFRFVKPIHAFARHGSIRKGSVDRPHCCGRVEGSRMT